MGYWKCPRCGSTDAYQGTELVGGHSQGHTVGMSNDHGGYIQRQHGGELKHKEVRVTKCRDCGEILADKDYYLTAEDRKQQALENQRAKQKAREDAQDETTGTVALVILLSIIAAVVYLFFRFT